MKKYFSIIVLIFLNYSVYSQIIKPYYKSSDNSECEIMFIGLTDSNTFIFFKYTKSLQSKIRLNINENSYIKDVQNGGKYSLINSINIPYSPAYHEFDNENQILYFSLTYPAIQRDTKEIDIYNENFNFYGVSLIRENIKDSLRPINFLNLLESTPVKEKGFYYKEGKVVQYIIHKSKVVAMHLSMSDLYGEYYVAYISIENYSNKRFDFFPEKMQALIVNGNISAKVWSYDDFMKKARKKQAWNTFFVALGEYVDANTAGYSYSQSSGYKNSYGFSSGYFGCSDGYVSGNVRTYSNFTSNTSSYNATANYYARQNAENNVNNYKNQQYQILNSINQGYLKTNTIFPNQRLNGYLNIDYIKTDCLKLSFTINSDEYSFTWPYNQQTENDQNAIFPIKTKEEILIENVISEHKYSEVKYECITQVQVGDIVKFKTVYGEDIYGIVTEIKGKKNVIFKTYPSIGVPLFWEEKYQNLLKIKG